MEGDSEVFSGREEEEDVFTENEPLGCSSRNTSAEERKALNEDFIRTLARDFIHYKLHGNNNNNNNNNNADFTHNIEQTITPSKLKLQRNLSFQELTTLNRAKKILRRTSCELERDHEEFFTNMHMNTRLDSAEESFRQISEEVLNPSKLNWGRVVSMFVYGGRLAEEFWKSRQDEKVVEVEDWLADCLQQKEEWITEQGGWDNFIEFFEETVWYQWLLPPLVLFSAGVLLAYFLTNRSK